MIHPLSRLSVALLAYVSCASAAVPLRRQNETTVAADRACNKLATAFPKSLYASNATEFENQSLAIWSQTCLLTPTCVFLPSSAAEIGEAQVLIFLPRHQPAAIAQVMAARRIGLKRAHQLHVRQ